VCTTEDFTTDWTIPVIPLDKILSSIELRSLTYACVTNREFSDFGLEVVLREMRKRTPVFPIIDTLVSECIRLVAQRGYDTFGAVPIAHKGVAMEFWTLQPPYVIRMVCREIEKGLRGDASSLLHLELLLRASDADIESMVIALFDLHSALILDRVGFKVINS
jgi:hypothetical protein